MQLLSVPIAIWMNTNVVDMSSTANHKKAIDRVELSVKRAASAGSVAAMAKSSSEDHQNEAHEKRLIGKPANIRDAGGSDCETIASSAK